MHRATVASGGDGRELSFIWWNLLCNGYKRVAEFPREPGTFSVARMGGVLHIAWIEREEAENGLVERLDESSPVSVASPGQGQKLLASRI